MNDLIERIVNAIFRHEDMPADSVDPGNLTAAYQPQNHPSGSGLWYPATRAEGMAGAAYVVARHIAMGKTLMQLINAWSPAKGNPTTSFVRNVKAWAKIPDEHQPLWMYLEDRK